MPTTASRSEPEPLVHLSGGLVVHESVFMWVSGLSFRGLQARELPDGRLYVGPRRAVTDADQQFIRSHRDEILAAVRYCDDEIAQVPQ